MQITAFPVNIPSQVDQDLWTAEYNAFIAANEYSVLRRVEYDKLNQDEMRYDDLIGDTTTWRDAISAIKIAIPKP